MLQTQDLAQIVANASSLDERLAAHQSFQLSGGTEDQAVTGRRLRLWLQALGGSEARLARRSALGAERKTVASVLVGTIATKTDAFPGWARTIAWIARAIENSGDQQTPSFNAPVPFEELLWSAVCAADRRLARRAGSAIRRCLETSARADLRRGLLNNLSAVCAQPLFDEFDLFRRAARLTPGHRRAIVVAPQEARPLYNAFVADCRDSMDTVLRAKPVLARLIGTVVENWLEATGEFVERLNSDLEAIAAAFAGGQELGRVTGIETNLSDPHRGGRTVTILRFASGMRIVYKPKDLRVDVAWASLVAWLTEEHAPVELKSMRVLSRGGYGWTEFAASEPLHPAQAPRFYRAAGAFLAMLHLLGARDMHAGNIVICGGLPVVIDLETLLPAEVTPGLREAANDAATLAASEQAARSVLATLFLPLWARPSDGRIVALGGIDGDRPQHDRQPNFIDTNTDRMAPSQKKASTGPSPEDGSSLVAAHVGDVIDGFAAFYSFLLTRRDALSAPTGPLAGFRDTVVRVVVRPTADYLAIQELARRSTNALGDGADWSLRFEALGSTIPTSSDMDAAWQIFAAERRAMSRLDVPFFSAAADGTAAESDGGDTISTCLAEAPFGSAMARIAGLSTDDLQRQIHLIQAALPAMRSPRILPALRAKPAKNLAAEAVSAAQRIATTIAKAAVRAGDGASWIGPVHIDHDHASLDVVETNLYAGTIGIALFLAALARSTADAEARTLALAAVSSAERLHAAPRGAARSVQRMSIGGAAGIGSAIYGLVRIGELLEERRLFDLATGLSLMITPERVAADRHFSVLRGAAGAILGLLSLHAVAHDPVVLERAAVCGRHLIANPDLSVLPDGLLEGKAGVALALWRLHAATGDPAFQPAVSNFGSADTAMSGGWCSGAPGIGFAVTTCINLRGNDFTPLVESALAAALASPPMSTDCICCGNFGRIDFLLTAGHRLGHEDLIHRAHAETEALLRSARDAGGFRLERRGDELQPGLFRGLSGIGYALLRVADPRKLPALLAWE